MILPPLNAKKNQAVQMLHFGGLDFRPKARQGSLHFAENLSADAYPALTSRKPRTKVVEAEGISAICAPEAEDRALTAFTGVRQGKFYCQGEEISGEELTKGEKSIADFNGKICIFPDKLYYDYLPDPDTGTVNKRLQPMEKTLTLSGAQFYSNYNTITGAFTAYIQKSGADFSRFQEGDSLTIRGCNIKQNNTCTVDGRKKYASSQDIVSAVVESVDSSRLNLLLFNKQGGYAHFVNTIESGSVTIGVQIPDMNHVCVHNNRLWGTAQNGEYIYASKLGDCQNFHSFQGLSDDSWYGRLGTPGEFTGICSYRSAVVAFKKECIHHVYGDAPRNFSIPKQTLGGCLDGRSIVEISGTLYYLSPTGFSVYSGGEPYCICHQLAGKNYIRAAAGTDGRRYTVAAYTQEGTCDVLVYDPLYGVWHREDGTPYLGFLSMGGRLYGATADAVWAFCHGEESVEWSMITAPLTYASMQHKGVNCLWLRLEREENACVTVEISHDGREFVLCGSLPLGSGFGVERVPVRFRNCDSFRLRISGTGKVILHDLEITTHQGGRNYGQ